MEDGFEVREEIQMNEEKFTGKAYVCKDRRKGEFL